MTIPISREIREKHTRQVLDWPLARKNYAALADVETKTVYLDMGSKVVVQHNPARAVSASARTDAASVGSRPCFLCRANRPPEQVVLAEERGYELLVNPFPVFPQHLTIASKAHVPQGLASRVGDMLAFARMLPGYAVFYNGPRCGASAPDHMHFQAVPAHLLPLVANWRRWGHAPLRYITFRARRGAEVAATMETVLRGLGGTLEAEPMVNVYAYQLEGWWPEEVEFVVVPRKAHRPSFYGTGEGRMLVSPAAVECAGVMITPRREDFERMDFLTLKKIYGEVCGDAMV